MRGRRAAGLDARHYGEVAAEQGIAVARRALAGPFNFLDTANNYGDGRSERRIGVALRDAGGVPDGFVLATKVDRDASGDFSGARVRRSLEESFHRLGISRAQLVYLHDPEHISFADGMAPGGPVEALVALRRRGPDPAPWRGRRAHRPAARVPEHRPLRGRADPQPLHPGGPQRRLAADAAAAARGLAAVNGAPFAAASGQGARGPAHLRLRAAVRRGAHAHRGAGRPRPATATRWRWPRWRCSTRSATRASPRPWSASRGPSGSTSSSGWRGCRSRTSSGPRWARRACPPAGWGRRCGRGPRRSSGRCARDRRAARSTAPSRAARARACCRCSARARPGAH